jgi:hypothetical protein
VVGDQAVFLAENVDAGSIGAGLKLDSSDFDSKITVYG